MGGVLSEFEKREIELLRKSLALVDAGYLLHGPDFHSCGLLLQLLDRLTETSKTLQAVAEAAEALSTAMVEQISRLDDANYDMIEEPWAHLTCAIQEWRNPKPSAKSA